MAVQTLKNFFLEFVATEPGLVFFYMKENPDESEVIRQFKKTLINIDIYVDSPQFRRSLKQGFSYRGFISATHPNLLHVVNLALELSNDLRLFVYSDKLSSLNIPKKIQFVRLDYHKNGLYIRGLFLKYLCLNKNLKVGLSNIQGLGLFSANSLSKGEVLFKLFGDIIHLPRGKKYDFSGEWNALDNNTLLKRSVRTTYGFINHSRYPNCKVNLENMQVETIKDIKIGEEILLDYRDEALPDAYIIEHGASYL